MSTTILSWNVNGMRSVLRNGFRDWLDSYQPDILCLQETRVLPDQIPDEERMPGKYASFWNPAKKKGYSGTGVYTKKEPLSITNIGKKEFDDEGRAQLIEFKEFTILNAYWPNSQPARKRIDYKLDFCKTLRRVCNKLVKDGRNVIACGDFNIAHTPIDLARPKQNEDNPGYLPEEREQMTRFLDAGYVDTFRHFCPDPGHYSWWSYRSNARANNVGWRLDYHVVNKEFLPRISSASILSDVTGSDHCPVAITVE